MRIRTTVYLGMGLLVLQAAPAVAASEASRAVHVSAEVAPFCNVRHQEGPLTIENGRADLGTVLEVCNSAGYRLTATFSNLAGGRIATGEEVAGIDADGSIALLRSEARKLQSNWQLDQAVVRDQNAPVTMRIDVSPL